MSAKHSDNASTVLANLVEAEEPETITIEEIMDALRHRGFGLLFILLAIPNLPPIPMIPGVSTLFGVPMMILAYQWMVGKHHPTLPRKVRQKEISRAKFNKVVNVCLPYLRKVERLCKPSVEGVLGRSGEIVFGVLSIVFAIVLAAPLPFSNLLPAYGLCAIGIGLLERDGRFVLGGTAIGIFGIWFLYWIGEQAIDWLLSFF